MAISKAQKRKKIHMRIRRKFKGTPGVPRLCVYRSNKSIYAQLIDDINGVTLCSANSNGINGTKQEQATAVGKAIGSKIKGMNIEQVVFDRAGYLYHGRVKALADGAREAGLKF